MNERQQQFLRRLVTEPDWETIKQLAEELIREIQESPKLSRSAWQTLQKTAFDEGQVQGIRKFVQTIMEEATK